MAMRLLAVSDDGSFVQERFAKDSIPPYAILSHRWSTNEDDEITFREVAEGICDKRKPGFEKLQFCSTQAKADGLQYFWVDTCCINQSDQNELSVAIYSMFRWYQKAVKCYVYLADVSTKKQKLRNILSKYAWEAAFRSSKWFTRGWTLQELLAPAIVEFYSRDGVRLGDKSSLERQIAKTTGIPIPALRGRSLSRFTPEEIFSWVEKRCTKKSEDKAYCLLGVFNVSMLLDYGEGEKIAFSRLYREIENRVPDMNNLLETLPYAADAPFNTSKWQHEPTCLPDTRVDLQQQIHDWIDGGDHRTIFWLNGLAGTGKSTIARTIASSCFQQGRLGASFFFSKGGGDISRASKFFTTIATQLSEESQYLKRCVYDAIKENKSIATQSYANQWRQLILGPLSKLDRGYRPFSFVFVIDALDECESDDDIRLILQLLVEAQSLRKVRLRIFLTSRPEVPIRHGIYRILDAEHQDFILHHVPPTIINHDISLFLVYNLRIIRQEWSLRADWPGDVVLGELVRKSSGLFIWAATACRFIGEGEVFAEARLEEILKGTGSKGTPEQHLDQIYLTVLQSSVPLNFRESEKAQLHTRRRRVLGSIIILLSPLSAISLAKLINIPDKQIISMLEKLHAILAVPKDITNVLRLHHPSFRDFLLNKDRCREFVVDEKETHQTLATSCIQLMSKTLKKDIGEMHAPGSQVCQVESVRIKTYLPPEVQYACLYWVQHLQRSGSQVLNSDVHRFLQTHLLHWLEALGWIGKTSEGVQAVLSLEAHVPANENPDLHAFIHDAKRFVLYNRSVIEQTPLQLYCSGLVFAPEKSIVRQQFEKNIPSWIRGKPRIQAYWNAALQTLEGHTDSVKSVAFSPDGKLIVSGSYDDTVRVWDAATGAARQTLEGHTASVSSVAFSPDGTLIVSGSYDDTVRVWDAATGAARQTLEGHTGSVYSVAFSPDGTLIVSGSYDYTVRVWDAATGAARQTLKGHTSWVYSVAFSPDGTLIVSGSNDHTVRVWDAATGAARQTLEGHTASVSSVAFSPDGTLIVSGSNDHTVRVWDAATGAARQTLEGHTNPVYSVAFSPDGTLIVSGSYDDTVRVWDAATGAARQTLEGHTDPVYSVAFSRDGTLIVSGSYDHTVRVWDAATGAARQTLEGHTSYVNSVAFSRDGKLIVSGSHDHTVRVWDAATGAARQTLEGHTGSVYSVAFSPDGTLIVSGSYDYTVRVWDAATGAARQTLKGHTGSVYSVAFSPDGTLIVSGSNDYTVRVWDAATGAARQTLEGHTASVSSVAFSPDGTLIVSGSYDDTVRVWDAATGAARQTLEGHTASVSSVAFSPDGTLIVSGSYDDTVRVWDAATGAARQTLEGHTSSVNSVAFSLDSQLVPPLLVLGQWIVEGNTKILWLPAEYRPTRTAVYGGFIVLGHTSGRVSRFEFVRGPKLIS